MNEYVKASIDARKNSFYNAYNITDENLKNKIEELFNQIEELGKTCSDASDFEAKFSSIPLNQEYINLFTEVAITSSSVTYESNTEVQSDNDYVKDEINSELKYQADSLTQDLRRELHQEAYDKVRIYQLLVML